MSKVRLSSDARNFLRRETRYLSQHSTTAARTLLGLIDQARSHLSRFPAIGPAIQAPPVPGIRRCVAGAYVIDYQIDGDTVSILSIRHGRMDARLGEDEAELLDDISNRTIPDR